METARGAPATGHGVLGSEATTVLLSAVVPIATALLLRAAKQDDWLVGVASGSMGTLVPALKLGRRHASKSRDERVLEAGDDSDHANPLLLALMAASLIVVIEFLAGAFVGAVGSSSIVAAGFDGVPAEHMTDYTAVLVLFAWVLLFIAVIPIGRQLSLRAPSDPRRWIAVAVVASRVLSLLAGAAMGEDIAFTAALLHILIVGLVLLAGAMIGHLLAKRARDGFAAARLLRALDRPERRAFLDRMRAEATATAAMHAPPAVPAPAVPAPAVHAPAVPAPAVHAPAVRPPTTPAPVVPAPTIAAPIEPIPTVAGPAPMRVRRSKAPAPPSPAEPPLPVTMRVRRSRRDK